MYVLVLVLKYFLYIIIVPPFPFFLPLFFSCTSVKIIYLFIYCSVKLSVLAWGEWSIMSRGPGPNDGSFIHSPTISLALWISHTHLHKERPSSIISKWTKTEACIFILSEAHFFSYPGLSCDSCEFGYWNLSHPDGCIPCDCDPLGSLSSFCEPSGGQCECKPGVGGQRCDSCGRGLYGLRLEGSCAPCNCSRDGTVPGRNCDPYTGQCVCKVCTDGSQYIRIKIKIIYIYCFKFKMSRLIIIDLIHPEACVSNVYSLLLLKVTRNSISFCWWKC